VAHGTDPLDPCSYPTGVERRPGPWKECVPKPAGAKNPPRRFIPVPPSLREKTKKAPDPSAPAGPPPRP